MASSVETSLPRWYAKSDYNGAGLLPLMGRSQNGKSLDSGSVPMFIGLGCLLSCRGLLFKARLGRPFLGPEAYGRGKLQYLLSLMLHIQSSHLFNGPLDRDHKRELKQHMQDAAAGTLFIHPKELSMQLYHLSLLRLVSDRLKGSLSISTR